MKSKVTKPCELSRVPFSFAFACENGQPVFRSVTLVVFLVLFVGINTQGDDKEQKNGGDRKTQVGLDLAVC